MLRGLAAAATVTGTVTTGGAAQDSPAGPTDRSWDLVWADEFDGETVSDAWTFETGGGCGPDRRLDTSCSWGNWESQYYTDGDNARIEDGALVVEAREEPAPNGVNEYTSARLKTQGNHSVRYGRIDVRATLPEGQGIWPAVWLLGEDITTRGWPGCGEIDVMEFLGHDGDTVHGTVHGPGYSGADGIGGAYDLPSGTFSDSAHTFSVVWGPDRIDWYVDGEGYHAVTREQVESAGNEWVFDHEFFLLLNVAVGGRWPGYPDETTTFPQRMRVEFVRQYEAVDPTPTDGGDALPPVTTDRPRDPDEDGHYEDVTGDGTVDFNDLVAHYQHQDDRAMTDHVDAYDYTDDGDLDFNDLVSLYREL